jgi:hypothetical protein
VTPHPKAGEFTPVYALEADGSPVFKKDKAGNDTEERLIRCPTSTTCPTRSV